MTLQIEQVLKDNPTLPRIFQCSNLLSYFRSDQTDLTEFLTEENNFKNLLLIIHKTKDSNLIRLIHGLFTSYNTSLLKMFPISRENTLNLIDFFDNKSPNYISKNLIQNAMRAKSTNQNNLFFMISTSFNILFAAFYNWPDEMFSILNSSTELSNYILTNINYLPISNFCENLVGFSSLSQPFVWLSYRSLMGSFGPGGPAPLSFSSEPISAFKEPSISVQQRSQILRIISIFFNKYKKESTDFSKVISFALPVLLQKAISNSERCQILELAQNLPKSDAIIKCCNSILFSDCKDRQLIELSFQYLALYPPQPNPNELEILIFDVLNRRTNNFTINAFISFFRNQMSLFEMTKSFVEKARNIIIYSMKSQKSTLLLRSARIEIVNSINGKEMMNSSLFKIDDFLLEDIKRQRLNNCSSSYDTSRIKFIKEQIASNDKKQPIFDASILWGPKATVNMSYFKNFNKPKNNQVTAAKRKKIENAFESVEVEDDEDCLDDNDNDGVDFLNRNNKKNLPLTANQGQKKNLKTNQPASKEGFKSRQLASKKKNHSFLSFQKQKQEQQKNSSPSKLIRSSQKVDLNKNQTNKISTSASTSSLNMINKEHDNLIRMKANSRQQQLQQQQKQIHLKNNSVNEYDKDDNDDDYDEQVQSWNGHQKTLQNDRSAENKTHIQIQKQASYAPEKVKQSKTPTKIRSSQSASITFKTKKIASTPQKRIKSGNPQQGNNNLNKKNIVH